MKRANYGERVMRSGQPFQFTWLAARKHQSVEARPVESLAMSPGEPEMCLVQVGLEAVRYNPFRSATGLFREFAGLALKGEAIQTFANNYGMLEEKLVAVPDGNLRRGEPEHLWFGQIKEIRRWVKLWDLLRSESGMLKDIIKWRDKDSVMIDHDGHQEWIATSVLYPELLPRFVYGDLVQPALYQLQRVINEKLIKHKSTPQLLWDNGKLLYFIRPDTLLAAIWLQFALAVDGDRHYRICRGCSRWFEVGGGTRRSDAQTCDSTCRKRLERKVARAVKEAEQRRKAARRSKVRRIKQVRRTA